MDAPVVVDTELRLIDGEVQSPHTVLVHPQGVGAGLQGCGCSEGEEDQRARPLPPLLAAAFRPTHAEANPHVPDPCAGAGRAFIERRPDVLHQRLLLAQQTVVGVTRDQHA